MLPVNKSLPFSTCAKQHIGAMSNNSVKRFFIGDWFAVQVSKPIFPELVGGVILFEEDCCANTQVGQNKS